MQYMPPQESLAMTELKRYRIHYLINGEPASLTLSAFEAPWEIPERASEHSRMAELGVSDIQIEEEAHR